MTPTRSLILGTAGHIDHGKTALVAALTGIDTDRLAEEKERGISIEIGFAHLDLDGARLGIVDLPGHERFIRNMLAGASGIDVALLVVAADDSVMPQTREHLAILRLLQVRHGIVALTKSDLVEPAWLELVEQDIAELVAGSFLENAPIIRTSVTDGTGIDDLRTAIGDVAARVEPPACDAPFRLAVDRSFVRQGRGTVVTGTVWSGSVAVGDDLEVQPAQRPVKVRGIHSHGEVVESVERGQRAAINLHGAHHREIQRGDELAAPGWLRAGRILTARLHLLDDAPWPLKHRSRVRLHLGTRETIAEVRLLEGTILEPGATADAQLHTVEAVVATGGQPLVLRAISPIWTLGGGTVLQPAARPLSRRDPGERARLEALASDDPAARVAEAMYFRGARPGTDLDLQREAAVDAEVLATALDRLRAAGTLLEIAPGTRRARTLHRDVFDRLRTRLTETLRRIHEREPLVAAVPRRRLMQAQPGLDPEIGHALLVTLLERGDLTGTEDAVTLAGFAPILTESQRALRERVLSAYRDGAFSPPSAAEVASGAGVREDEVMPIVELCVTERELAHLGGSVFLHREWEQRLRERIVEHLGDGRPRTMSEIKDLLGTSRKYAVPICEYLDRIGLTLRRDDVRVLKGV